MQRNAFRISNITAPGNSLNLCLGNNIWVALLPVTATKIYNIFINTYFEMCTTLLRGGEKRGCTLVDKEYLRPNSASIPKSFR